MNILGLPEAPGKILIVKPSALGDIVHGLPFLSALRSRFSESMAEIHWVVASSFHDILQGHPMIDRLWVLDKDEWRSPARLRHAFAKLKALASDLRAEHFDIVVDLQGLLRSGIIAVSTGAKVRIGFNEAREGSCILYTHRVSGGRDVHAVDRYMKIAAYLGCNIENPHFVFPPFNNSSPILRSLPKEYAVIAPSAGGEAKKWPPERFGQLASRLPLESVIIAGKSDIEQARRVLSESGGKAICLAGKTNLKELISVIKGAKYLVSNDTGPMHIAAALHVPVFAIIGPTNPVRTGPYGKIHTIIRANLPCSPCYRRKRCNDWRCMNSVTVEQVLECLEDRNQL